jgi:CheY-like chemotaxis protein
MTATPQILIVENDGDLRTVVRMLLEREGYSVIDARGGTEALLLAEEHRFDLVIADLRMPIMSGHELARRLRSNVRTATVPVLFVTGDSNFEVAEAEANTLLRKPFEVDELIKRVASLIAATSQPQPKKGV